MFVGIYWVIFKKDACEMLARCKLGMACAEFACLFRGIQIEGEEKMICFPLPLCVG